MSIIFPKNNLPEAAQAWAREVQKQLDSVVTSSTNDEVNNSARDIQLNNSVLSLTAVVNELKSTTATASQAASDASAAAAEALSAANAALDAQNAADAAQSDANAALSDLGDIASGTGTFTINAGALAGGNVRDGVLNLTSGSNSSIELFNGGVDINGPGSQVRVGTAGLGRTTIEGRIDFNGTVYGPGMSAAQTNVSNVRRNTGTANELVHTNESSIRFKKDIVDLVEVEELNPKKLLDIPVRAFRYKEDYPIQPTDCRYQKLMPGFIAEEVYAVYPIGADIENGTTDVVENWNDRIIIPGMLALIQELYKRIEILENKDKV